MSQVLVTEKPKQVQKKKEKKVHVVYIFPERQVD